MRIIEALRTGSKILLKNDIKSKDLDAELLLSEVIKKDRSFLIFNQDYPLNTKAYTKFIELIQKRSSRIPIAYLTNKKDFWQNQFYVDRRALIPRPDTEILIEQILDLIKKENISLLEIGVGSGCIILSILSEKIRVNGVGIDISKEALEVCRLNIKRFKLENRLKLIKSDIDKFNQGKYDIIVSNPPYICKSDLRSLNKDFARYEPKKALDGGVDGTSEIRKVIEKSSKLIKKGGKLVLEIGNKQKIKVINILNSNGFYSNKVFKDYSKNERCIISTKI